ncbi:MAG TPA: phospholipase D-like domain-containing protein [Steroidobacteraceae bacterium]|nr:phospholipase D-like domain-containing protein [Steroidobacteraceae bacterium]
MGLIAVLTWASCAIWNSVKPLPPGTHVSSLPARLAESQVDFIDDDSHHSTTLKREFEAIGRAEQLIVLDLCPLAHELAEQLLLRKRQRPNLKIVLVTDPRNEVYGGTPAQTLSILETAGIIVARTRLALLRDSDPLYSSLWRLGIGWWSDPFDEVPGETTLISELRRRNLKANQRQLLVADDGAGGWTSIVMSAASGGAAATAKVGLEIRGPLARDIVASELRIAAWSTDDDRLPVAPPTMGRGVGTIDARFLTEGAIHAALRDVIAITGSGDSISVLMGTFDDRQMVNAMLRAAARGVRLQLVLDPAFPGTRAAAGELVHDAAGNVEVRWQAAAAPTEARYALIRHRNDVWINLGSANFTHRDLDDLNLEADVELHMPARTAPARAAAELFSREWSSAAAYADYADESAATYWRYRLADVTGLAMF